MRITVPLPSTLFDLRRRAEVELPMTCTTPAITPWFVGVPLLMCFVVGCGVVAAFQGAPIMAAFAGLMMPFAAAATAQLFARLALGDGQIIIDEKGLLDTRYGSSPIPWSAFRTVSILQARQYLIGVVLFYKEEPATLPAMVGHLANTGFPFGLRQRMMVELKSVWNGEIVASTIKFLVDRHVADQAEATRS